MCAEACGAYAGIAPRPEATGGISAAASASCDSQDVSDEGSRCGGTRSGGAGEVEAGRVQGPLQLSSTAKAWREGLGDVDVGKWDLIYRQAHSAMPALQKS